MTSVLQKYAEFVIKLKLVGTGGAPQIRRVRLKNITVGQDVSYDELVTLAIGYTYPNASSIDPDDFEVTLTYYDVDNDCVTLATSEELVDAMEQYADAGGRGTLRLTTDVRRKKPKSRKSESSSSRKSSSRSSTSPSTMTTSPPESPVPPETVTTVATEEIPATPEPAAVPHVTSPRLHASSPHSQLQALLESFVSILAAAVVAIQSLSPPPPPLPTSTPTTTDAAVPASVAEESATVEASNETPEDPVAPVIHMPQSSSDPPATFAEPDTIHSATLDAPPEPTVQVPEEPTIHVEPEPTHVEQTVVEAPEVVSALAAPAARGIEEEETRPFIHGRHTCDGCLSTPIVGIRYHATNLKDYDLCERCKENYKGTEIHFESVELERDRAFQDRWHRRRNKWSQYGGRCRGPGPRHHGFRPGHHPHHPPPFGPPEAMPPQPPFGAAGPPHLIPPFMPPHVFGHPPPPPPGPEEFDAALKEAIQRSLKDLIEKEVANASTAGEHTEEASPTVVSAPEPPAPTAPTVEEVNHNDQSSSTETVVSAEESIIAEPAQEDTEPVSESEWVKDDMDETKTAAESEDSVEENEISVEPNEPDVTGAAIAVKTDASVNECDIVVCEDAAKEPAEPIVAATDKMIDVAEPPEAVKPTESSVKADDDDFGVLPSYEEIANSVELSFPKSNVGNISPVKSESEFPSLEEPSFSSDAFGNGDVAEALGQTLDRCARAIDDMVNELRRADSHESNFQHDDDDSDMTSSHQASAGATILEAVDDGDTKPSATKLDDEKSDDGWQVVTDSEQVADDEILARAAQVIGSALFNSDVSRSGVISTLSGSAGESVSTELSVPTVPSVVPSLATAEDKSISVAQLHRFAVQLNQLHELGFHNDDATIEILERLTAANVGADLFEEVSVTQVVNELLSRE